MSYIKKLPSNPTRDQLVAWKIQTGECGLIRQDFSTACPRRNGPVNPSPDHPRMVGFPGENGFCTCSGCQYFLGLQFDSYVCTHPNAHAVAAKALAEAIRHWEEEQGQGAVESAPLQRAQEPAQEPETPDQVAEGQLSLF
jgi:hypothetical protein